MHEMSLFIIKTFNKPLIVRISSKSYHIYYNIRSIKFKLVFIHSENGLSSDRNVGWYTYYHPGWSPSL